MRVPNADNAVVAKEKLVDYCLDPTNEIGQHKAKVFLSALGISQINFELLRVALLEAVKVTEATLDKSSIHGDIYQVDFEMVNGTKTAIVRSAWMINKGATIPRLISCYIKK